MEADKTLKLSEDSIIQLKITETNKTEHHLNNVEATNELKHSSNVGLQQTTNVVQLENTTDVELQETSNVVELGNTADVELQENTPVVQLDNTTNVELQEATNVVQLENTTNVELQETTNVVELENTTNVELQEVTSVVQLEDTTNVELQDVANVVQLENTADVELPENTTIVQIQSTSNVIELQETPGEMGLSVGTKLVELQEVTDCYDNELENFVKDSSIDLKTRWAEVAGHGIDDENLIFKKLKNCSMHGRDLLIDSDGHSYTLKGDSRRKSVVWKCRERVATKKSPICCYAQVTQVGKYFIAGKHEHICEPVPSKLFNTCNNWFSIYYDHNTTLCNTL